VNILIVGYEEDIPKVIDSMEQEGNSIGILYWDDYATVLELCEEKLDCYDVIIVAVRNKKEAIEITKMLEKYIAVPSEKIIDFYSFYKNSIPLMNVDKVMSSSIQNFNGIILGISHAEVGVIPEMLGKAFANLAVSSQDLYYNLKTLEYCLERYPQKIRGLEYLVIDLFDYTYFNYDASLSKSFYSYLTIGGYNLDPHNFIYNKNMNISFDDLVYLVLDRRFSGINSDKLKLWACLFGDIHKKEGFKSYSLVDSLYFRNQTVTEKHVDEYVVETSIVKNRFEDTIAENIAYFYKILELAYQINPKIKILCMLIPRYAKVQKKCEKAYVNWKKEFYNIISEARKKYDFRFIDMKDIELANDPDLFFDVSHFNYVGALKFSKLLADEIKKL